MTYPEETLALFIYLLVSGDFLAVILSETTSCSLIHHGARGECLVPRSFIKPISINTHIHKGMVRRPRGLSQYTDYKFSSKQIMTVFFSGRNLQLQKYNKWQCGTNMMLQNYPKIAQISHCGDSHFCYVAFVVKLVNLSLNLQHVCVFACAFSQAAVLSSAHAHALADTTHVNECMYSTSV